MDNEGSSPWRAGKVSALSELNTFGNGTRGQTEQGRRHVDIMR